MGQVGAYQWIAPHTVFIKSHTLWAGRYTMKRRALRVKRKASAAGKPKLARPKAKASTTGMLDAGALAHRRLLLDPCNAPLAGPVYSGSGSGQFRRYRSIIVAEGNSVEGCYVFQFAANSLWKASHVSSTAGDPYTFGSGGAIFVDGNAFNTHSEVRCIAACVKVRYVGTEAERKGTIGLLSSAFNYQGTGEQSSAAEDTTRCPVVHRTGEVQHEVKWCPSAQDEQFRVPGNGDYSIPGAACCVVAYRGVPAQTIQFEVTAVYEVELANQGVVTSVAPTSQTTLNQLLRTLGPVSQWAYGNIIAPTIRAAAGAAVNTMYSSVTAAAKGIGMLAL